MTDTSIFLGKSEKPESLALKYANRHGLISGATGTGKTVTLQIMTEGFSQAGVPVFVADVKGDLSGLSQPVEMKDFLTGLLLGSVWRARSPDPRDGFRNGPALAVAPP